MSPEVQGVERSGSPCSAPFTAGLVSEGFMQLWGLLCGDSAWLRNTIAVAAWGRSNSNWEWGVWMGPAVCRWIDQPSTQRQSCGQHIAERPGQHRALRWLSQHGSASAPVPQRGGRGLSCPCTFWAVDLVWAEQVYAGYQEGCEGVPLPFALKQFLCLFGWALDHKGKTVFANDQDSLEEASLAGQVAGVLLLQARATTAKSVVGAGVCDRSMPARS